MCLYTIESFYCPPRFKHGEQSAVQREPGPVRPGFGGREKQQICGVSTLRIQGAQPRDSGAGKEGGKSILMLNLRIIVMTHWE